MADEMELLDRVRRIESMLYTLMVHQGVDREIIRPPRRKKASHEMVEEKPSCELFTAQQQRR